MEMEKLNWTEWVKMPSPETCKSIKAPEKAGVYQIKNFKTKEFIQFGESKICQYRMQSLFPKPYGRGTRNNEIKRIYILDNWKDLKYRTIKAATKEEAIMIDRFLKSLCIHKFNT